MSERVGVEDEGSQGLITLSYNPSSGPWLGFYGDPKTGLGLAIENSALIINR